MFDQVIHNTYTLITNEFTSALKIYDFFAINFILPLKILTNIIFLTRLLACHFLN